MTLLVRSVRITGSTVYSQERLAELAAPLIGKRISLVEVYALAAHITALFTALYGTDGYVLSRAIIPPQSIDPKGAVVHIEIVEGYVDQVVWPSGIKERHRDFFTEYLIPRGHSAEILEWARAQRTEFMR